MSLNQFLIIAVCVAVTMLICRVVPLFVMKDRKLSPKAERALNLIPPAAYAALVANDLFSPDMFADGVVQGVIPLIAAALVVLVGYKTKSLLWCIIVGVVCYGLLLLASSYLF